MVTIDGYTNDSIPTDTESNNTIENPIFIYLFKYINKNKEIKDYMME